MSTVTTALALAALVCGNVFLLLTAIGFSIQDDTTIGSRIWASFGVLSVLFALDAYGLDQLGRHFGL